MRTAVGRRPVALRGRTTLALTASLALSATLAAVVSPSPAGATLEQRLPALIAFVEAERGLELRRDVEVQVLDDEAFVDALNEDPYAEDADAEAADAEAADAEAADADDPHAGLPPEGRAATYGALGLAAAEHFDADLRAQGDESFVGFYDGVSERLVVRDDVGPYVELVVVHELVHALQDQWFGVDRPSLGVDTEPQLAFSSLVEGDARRIERAWYAQLDADDRRTIDGLDPDVGAPADDDGRLLDPVESTLAFPYAVGPGLVAHLLADGGQEALDAAFRDPPVTTEQVLHPEELATSGTPLVPPAPEHDGTVVDEGVLGERGLALLAGYDPLEPGGPQVGWEGDSYRTSRLPDGQLCTVARVVMADAAAALRLAAALEEVAVEVAAADGPSIDLTSCTGPEA